MSARTEDMLRAFAYGRMDTVIRVLRASATDLVFTHEELNDVELLPKDSPIALVRIARGRYVLCWHMRRVAFFESDTELLRTVNERIRRENLQYGPHGTA